MTRQLTSAVRHKLLRSPHAKRPPHGRLRSSRLVWSGSGLKSTWMENAHFVEVERHPLYTRVREIFLKRGRELAVTV